MGLLNSLKRNRLGLGFKGIFSSTISKVFLVIPFIGIQFLNADIHVLPNLDTGLDTNGNIFKIWQGTDSGSGNQAVYTSTGTMLGVWGAPQTLSSLAYNSYDPIIGVLPSGDAIALWLILDTLNGCNVLYASYYTSGSWGTPAQVSELTESVRFGSYKCTIDNSNNVIAAWESMDLQIVNDQIASYVRAAASTVGGSWATPTTIATL